MPLPATALLTLFFSLLLGLGAWAQGVPEITVNEAGNDVADGKVYLEGYRVVGTTRVLVFGVQNTGTAPLTGLQLIADGPDADVLTITDQPVSTLAPGASTYFRALVSPTRVGPYTAHLRLASNDADENPFDLTYSGTGTTADPDIRVEQPVANVLMNGAVKDFGNVSTFSTITFTLRNAGGSGLSGIAASIAGPHASDYEITQSPVATLAINSYSIFKVRFTPTGLGQRTSTLSIISNDPNENPFLIPLTGTGTHDQPDIRLEQAGPGELPNGSTFSFGSVLTKDLTFTIKNTGLVTLTNVAASITGTHTNDYYVIQAPSSSVLVNSSTTLVVRFIPRDLGLRTATLSIVSNDPDESPFLLQLTGMMSPPDISVQQPFANELTSGVTRSFGTIEGSVSMTFTIRNTGLLALTNVAASIIGTHATDYYIMQAPSSSPLTSASTTLVIRFTPTGVGERKATLSIASNDPDENPFIIHLTGTRVEPEITVSSYPLNKLLDSGYTASWTPGLTGVTKAQSFILTNTGEGYLSGVVASISGPHASEYAISTAPTVSLAPNASTWLIVTVRPDGEGLRPAVLSIASNDADENPFVIQLAGSGPAPDIQLEEENSTNAIQDGASYDFGEVHTSGGKSMQFKVRNLGIQPLTGLAILKDGIHAANYVIKQDLTVTELAPGTSTTFTVQFTPNASSLHTAALHIISDDPDENPYDIQLSGEGIQPRFVLEDTNGAEVPTGTSLDFGSVAFGQKGRRDFTIRNTGVTPLVFSEAEFFNGSGFAFNHSFLGQVQIQPGASQSFTVWFAPFSFGQHSTSLRILSNDLEASPFELHLTGLGLRPSFILEPSISVYTSFGWHEVGAEFSKTFTITNSGNAPLHHTVEIEGDHPTDYVVRTAAQSPLPPKESTSFTIVFSPKALGARSAFLKITHDGGYGSDSTNVAGGWLYGSGILSRVNLSSTSFTAAHGDAEALVTLTRTPSAMPVTVQLDLTSGTAQAMPPVEPAIAGTDYTPLTGEAAQVSFAAGEAQKTVSIPLLALASRTDVNRWLNLTLSNPSSGAELMAPTEATLTILAEDSTQPTLTLSAPAAGKMQATQDTLTLRGRVGDAKGISSLTLQLNGAAPVLLPLGPYTSLEDIPFELVITPLVGPNQITITAVDPRGNTTTLTRDFIYARLRTLTVDIVDAPDGQAATAGTLRLTTTPGNAPVPVLTTLVGAAPKTLQVEVGAQVKASTMVSAAKGYVFSSYSTGASDDTHLLANETAFIMPDEDVSLRAWLQTFDSAFPKEALSLHGLLDSGLPAADGKGYLSGTLTPRGMFTGKFQVRGRSQSVRATCFPNAPATFMVNGRKRNSLPVPGGTLSLVSHDVRGLTVTYTPEDGSQSMSAECKEALYSKAQRVPSSLLNNGFKGLYTILLSPQRTPELPSSAYPLNVGFTTVALSSSGQVYLAGMLPDGTSITSSTTLVEDHAMPVFMQLQTPGGNTRNGLLFGEMRIVAESVVGTLKWFRPAAASPRILLYPGGWPGGLLVDIHGAVYNTRMSVQSALGLNLTESMTSPARLTFSGGGLPAPVTKTSFGIKDSTVVKTIPVDDSYSLRLSPSSGLFSGTFTPGLSQAARFFRGVIIQSGAFRGAHGIFLNNARNKPAPESGSVTLGPP